MNTNTITSICPLLMAASIIGIPLFEGDAHADSIHWSVSDGGNGHFYEVIVPAGGITWTDAHAAAEAAGGHLATLNSLDEFEFVNGLDHPTKGWVGGFEDGAGWHWVTNEPFEDAQWCSGQPGEGGDYLQLAYGCLIADGDTPDEGEFYVIEYGDPVQWGTEFGGNGHWYGFAPAFIPWSDARLAAESVGGYLCCMETEKEWAWIRTEMVEPLADELFSEGGWGVCIGGFQNLDSPDYSEPYGGWEWLTGVPFQCGGEFDCNMENYWGVQHNMALVQNSPGSPIQFNDIDEVPDQPYYMIEWSADCNGDGIVDYGQILDGTLEDADNNGVPDICDGAVPSTWVWGDNTHGQCDAPLDLASVLEMNGTGAHVVALLPGGAVRCWGRNQYGQSDVPADLGVIIAVAAGDQHSVALRADGTVRCWGANMHGQCDVPSDLDEVVAIGSGANHTLAVMADGTVRAWGYNPHGATNVPAWLDGVTKVTGGAHHSVALRADGTVVAWGGTYGESNVPAELSDAVDIKASNYNTIALDGSGDVFAWGRNWFGQTNVPPSLGPCAVIGIGSEHGMAVERDGSIVCWGSASDGQCVLPEDIGPVDALGETGVFVTAWVSFKDCNGDGQADYEQISDGSLEDSNGNGIPDVCECAADINGDSSVTVNDLLIIIAQWGTEGPLGDIDQDGIVNISDLLLAIQSWGECS